MLNGLSFDDLSSEEFEEFIYDLMINLGFTYVGWRKGTGLDASPADQGRDIEGVLQRKDVDGSTVSDHWFVECKHHKKGVSPDQIQNLLTWAEAEDPDVCVLAVSEFLSNPSKLYLDRYKTNRKPRFQIRTWERPDLQRLIAGKDTLLKKYSLALNQGFVNLLHPLHLEFLRNQPLIHLEVLFEHLDRYKGDDLDDILGWLPLHIVNPRFRQAKTSDELLADMMDRPITYEALKEKCRVLAEDIEEVFLARSMVSSILWILLQYGDHTRLDEIVNNNKKAIEIAKRKIRDDSQNADGYQGVIERNKEQIRKLPEQTKRIYSLYERFCDETLRALYLYGDKISESIILDAFRRH